MADEFLFTEAPLTDITSGTNAGFVIDVNQNGPRELSVRRDLCDLVQTGRDG
jgi:hypothetical protein